VGIPLNGGECRSWGIEEKLLTILRRSQMLNHFVDASA
jgi:hypothetical protein